MHVAIVESTVTAGRTPLSLSNCMAASVRVYMTSVGIHVVFRGVGLNTIAARDRFASGGASVSDS